MRVRKAHPFETGIGLCHGLRLTRLLTGGYALFSASASYAQTVLITPTIDPDFNRGRNISVLERPHPDYDQLGTRIGSFVLRPSVAIAAVTTDNVFLDDSNRRGDIFLNLRPLISVDSDWAVHSFRLIAAGDLRRYSTQTLRNQDAWFVFGTGRLDIRSDANVQIDVQADRTVESPFFEDVAANLTVPSSYLRSFASIKTVYAPGRSRFSIAGDVSGFAFNTISFAGGSSRDQRFRNRSIYRGAVVYEYGLSPSIALYGQLTADVTDYETAEQNGLPNRDSNSFGISFGSNFDLAGVARGNIGVGYSRRRYDATTVYPIAQGVSVQARVEFFPTPLYTVRLSLQRQLQDVNIGNGGAFWNNVLSVDVDHEVTENAIVSGSVQAIRREFVELGSFSEVYQAQVSARYQSTRILGFNAEMSYGTNTTVGQNLGNPFREFRATIGVRFRN